MFVCSSQILIPSMVLCILGFVVVEKFQRWTYLCCVWKALFDCQREFRNGKGREWGGKEWEGVCLGVLYSWEELDQALTSIIN